MSDFKKIECETSDLTKKRENTQKKVSTTAIQSAQPQNEIWQKDRGQPKKNKKNFLSSNFSPNFSEILHNIRFFHLLHFQVSPSFDYESLVRGVSCVYRQGRVMAVYREGSVILGPTHDASHSPPATSSLALVRSSGRAATSG